MNKNRCSFESKENYKYSTYNGPYINNESDISQKIKNLEVEGLKLRSQVENILHETSESGRSFTCDSMPDIDSNETICDDLAGSHDIWQDRERNNASSSKTQETRPTAGREDVVALKKELQETRDRLLYVQHKSEQEVHRREEERTELLRSMAELKKRQHRMREDMEVQTREGRDKERCREAMVDKLRSSLGRFMEVNKEQEQTLAEIAPRLNEIEAAGAVQNRLSELLRVMDPRSRAAEVETGCVGLWGVVVALERGVRGVLDDGETVRRQLGELEAELGNVRHGAAREKERAVLELRNRICYLEEQNGYMKSQLDEVVESADRETEKVKAEAHVVHQRLEEDISQASSVIDRLEANLRDLSSKYKKNNETWASEKKNFQKLLDDSEKQLVSVRSERDQAANQKSSIIAKLDATQSQLSETETQVLRLQSDKYELERAQDVTRRRNRDLEANLTATRLYLENITKTVHNNEPVRDDVNNSKAVEDTQKEEENDDTHHAEPWKPRKFDVDEVINHIRTANKKLVEVSNEYGDCKHRLERLQKQVDSLDQQNRKLEHNFKTKEMDVETLRNEGEHLNGLIANRNGEIDRLTAERDYYFQMLNEKTEDLANIKTENHRLAVTFIGKMDTINHNYNKLEERCRQLELSQTAGNQGNQSNWGNRTQTTGPVVIETGHARQQMLQEERARLSQQLQNTKVTRDQLISCQKEQHACIETLRQENANMQTELRNAYHDYDELMAESKRLQLKLKDSQEEVANLCREIQSHNSHKTRKNVSVEKKLADTGVELSKARNELKISRDRIRDLERSLELPTGAGQGRRADKGAVPPLVLNELGGQVTQMPSGFSDQEGRHWQLQQTRARLESLEQQMGVMEVSYNTVLAENDKLTNLLHKVTDQNERLTEELENYVDENRQLRARTGCGSGGGGGGEKKKLRQSAARDTSQYRVDKLNPRPQSSAGDKLVDDKAKDIEKQACIKLLQDDLQNSIREARKLLSSKYQTPSSSCGAVDDDDDEERDSSDHTKAQEDPLPVKVASQSRNNNALPVAPSHDSGQSRARSNLDQSGARRNIGQSGSRRDPPDRDIGPGPLSTRSSGTATSITTPSTSARECKSGIPKFNAIRPRNSQSTSPNRENSIRRSSLDTDGAAVAKDDVAQSNNHGSVTSSFRSDSASLTEVDRHFRYYNDKDAKSGPEQLLLATNPGPAGAISNTFQRCSNRDSFQLEEKIKRILAEG